ncbi:hypothetical protein BCR33DRAFT_722067 [Rhizoclosmatium globosum]|uniref:G-protein coupled receptors family 3 profile domain-containing protein n=1 Tax=Rhizoclosmatium globosum TaxID=329046 RepID=A0A1Y2BP85_9FUNG|nr:hypothetical protein BCR33DRAFT_722067 [Rhizoclosmatium globosum]|eukprot:ORY36559.1 hypothetical protein BCR33DRAFT_722067 [Rhizoclosmatium globosum]
MPLLTNLKPLSPAPLEIAEAEHTVYLAAAGISGAATVLGVVQLVCCVRSELKTTAQRSQLSSINVALLLACLSAIGLSLCKMTESVARIAEIFFLCMSEQCYLFFAWKRSYPLIKMTSAFIFKYLRMTIKVTPIITFSQLIPYIVYYMMSEKSPAVSIVYDSLMALTGAFVTSMDIIMVTCFIKYLRKVEDRLPDPSFVIIAKYGCISVLISFGATVLFVVHASSNYSYDIEMVLTALVYLLISTITGLQVAMKIALLRVKVDNLRGLDYAVKSSLDALDEAQGMSTGLSTTAQKQTLKVEGQVLASTIKSRAE